MPWDHVAAPHEAFSRIDIDHLDSSDDAFIDALPFGVVGLSAAGIAEIYNATETRYGGMQRANIIGQPFFLIAGVCMNNFLVAQRFEDEDVIDSIVDYVLTFRMRPTPVKLRLLKQPHISRRYLLIQR